MEDRGGVDGSSSGLQTHASVDAEGRVNIWLNMPEKQLPPLPPPTKRVNADPRGGADCPPMNIVIFIVGSRGDVQPYIALALQLIRTRGHRVRIATHGDFKDLVLKANERLDRRQRGRLEFFNVGGNPKELMAYMVKNPGLMPSWASLTSGDVRSKRKMAREYLRGFSHAVSYSDQLTRRSFAADAIISNPPAFAHIHLAEAYGLPLLLTFTMPWSPTTVCAHPLVNIQRSNAEPAGTNYLSYALADGLVWQGLGDVINRFRTRTLGLLPLAPSIGPLLCDRLRIPITYAWSEALLPKPKDWKDNIDIVGFYTLPALGAYKPDPELVKFLQAGAAPVYIGFGSIVVDNPDELTDMIIHAVEATGVRALVSAGWADLGAKDLPGSIFLIKGDVSHEWLFSEDRVSAVCHHGGAGTSAVGLKYGRPTIIIPFFGDQRFWGESVQRAGAGPAPIPYKELTGAVLAEAIQYASSEEVRAAAAEMGRRIRSENAEEAGVRSFHRHLPLRHMRCEIDRTKLALWWCDKHCIRLSGAAAALLVEQRKLVWRDLIPHRSIEYATNRHYSDPFTAGGGAIYDLVSQTLTSSGQMFYAPHRGLKGLLYDVPKASVQVIGALHEGVQNVPGLLGSHVRRTGQVNSLTTGFVEGGKSVTLGFWDGITGVATEPIQGAREEGTKGLMKGLGRGFVNLGARPIGGILSLVVLPTKGAYLGAKRRMSRLPSADMVLKPARQSASAEDLAQLTKAGREEIVQEWAECTTPAAVKRRRGLLEKRLHNAEAALLTVPKVKKRS